MTLRREELIEQAALEALGLLDERETEVFERAFEDAPENIQEQIRRIQAETVTDVAMLSGEEPPAGLRGKVLAAVVDAVEDEARELQPIASIGVRARRPGRAASTEVAVAVRDEREVLRLRAAQRHLLVWRAASIALAASLLTTMFWSGMYRLERYSIQQVADNGATLRQLEEQFGIKFAAEMRNSSFVRPVQAKMANASGTLMLQESSATGFLMVFGLTHNQAYTVRVLDAATGSVAFTGKIIGGDGITVARIDGFDRGSLAGKRIELLDAKGELVLDDKAV
jgi:hypothetical protein